MRKLKSLFNYLLNRIDLFLRRLQEPVNPARMRRIVLVLTTITLIIQSYIIYSYNKTFNDYQAQCVELAKALSVSDNLLHHVSHTLEAVLKEH